MSFNYTRMQERAKALLTRFNQGDKVVFTVTNIDGDDEYAPPINTATSETYVGVMKGVDSEMVDGSEILASDMVATLEYADVTTKNTFAVGGTLYAIQRVEHIPPAGVPVVTKLILRAGSAG